MKVLSKIYFKLEKSTVIAEIKLSLYSKLIQDNDITFKYSTLKTDIKLDSFDIVCCYT